MTRPALFGTLPALAVAAALAEFPIDHLRRVAGVDLMRGQNRYLAAIEQATRLVRAAL